MKKSLALAPVVVVMCALGVFSPALSFAQDEISHTALTASAFPAEAAPASAALPTASPIPAALPAPGGSGSSPRVGVGVMFGTLGIGGQVAVRVLGPLNVRVGFSGLGIGYNFDNDGINYGARLRLEGAEATADWFFFHGIHLSAGGLMYNGIRVTGTASVNSGRTFTLNDVTYESSSATPVTGTVGITFRKAAPVLGFGFGNLVPRKGRHWSITSDFGIAFSGSPNVALNLSGLACAPGSSSGASCLNVATNPTIQSNVTAEQSSVNSKVSFLKIFPLFSLGFGYSF